MSLITDSTTGSTETTDTTTLYGAIAYTVQDEDVLNPIAIFYFDIVKEHSISVQNQITDNWVENNTAIQDHIAHSPIEVTLSGLAGELVYKPAEMDNTAELLDTAKNNTTPGKFDKLRKLEVLLPQVSNLEQIARNAWDYGKATFDRYKGIIQSFKNSNNPMNAFYGESGENKETRLQKIYRQLLELRNVNAPMVVDTPYNRFTDMYIQSITLRQGEENYITDIEVSFKQLRFSTVTTTKADEKVMAQYNAWARAQEENHGTTQGKNKSMAAQLYDDRKKQD